MGGSSGLHFGMGPVLVCCGQAVVFFGGWLPFELLSVRTITGESGVGGSTSLAGFSLTGCFGVIVSLSNFSSIH